MNAPKARGMAPVASLVLTSLGAIVSGYLLVRTLVLLMSQDPDAFDVCSAVFGAGCDQTLISPTSWVLGIPLAGWGLVYYGILLVLFFMARALGASFAPQAFVTALWLSLGGLAGSLVLAAVLLAGWAPFCPLCMVIHGINLLLAPALKARIARSWRKIFHDTVAGARSLFQKPDKRPPEWHWKVTAFVTLALASLVLYQGVFIVSERWVYESRGIFNPHRLLAAFAATPETEFPPAPRGARKGPADAVAQVVAFTSFHCPACRQFNREFGVIMRRFSEDVVLEFRHFPLAAPCNPIMRASGLEQEAGACATSYAAVAAMRQGKFWEFHDTLFSEHFPPEDATPLAVAVEIGLDIEQFNADRKSEDVRAAVQADTELGAQLGIEETPAIFINRRRIPGAGPRALEVIIADIVKQHRN